MKIMDSIMQTCKVYVNRTLKWKILKTNSCEIIF